MRYNKFILFIILFISSSARAQAICTGDGVTVDQICTIGNITYVYPCPATLTANNAQTAITANQQNLIAQQKAIYAQARLIAVQAAVAGNAPLAAQQATLNTNLISAGLTPATVQAKADSET
jgi:hypothetical protein